MSGESDEDGIVVSDNENDREKTTRANVCGLPSISVVLSTVRERVRGPRSGGERANRCLV